MIRFEQHEGTLFRMLEEPVPLTPDAEMPRVVRLIQDDSRLGILNKLLHEGCYHEKYLCTSCNHQVCHILINGEEYDDFYPKYEIIGIFVEEGSEEWALYQMMQGEKVASSNGVVYWQDKDDNDLIKYTDGYGQKWIQTSCMFLKCVGASGWQLYKEPEPPREPEYIICKRCGGTGYEIKPEPAKEPIADCDNCKHACTKSNIDYCQMYEPKPTFKVGDLVRGKSGYAYKITAYPSKLLPNNPNVYDAIPVSSMYGQSLCLELSDIASKLDPSEVVLDFGSGIKGWIRRASNHTIEVYSKANCWLANIRYDMLDTETRKLVESLLKAQEGETK